MTDYASEVNDLETFLIAYLNVVVIKSLRIPDALNILTRYLRIQVAKLFSAAEQLNSFHLRKIYYSFHGP